MPDAPSTPPTRSDVDETAEEWSVDTADWLGAATWQIHWICAEDHAKFSGPAGNKKSVRKLDLSYIMVEFKRSLALH